jgi:mRNA-degrading endonuclease RelE of RelBE toxin-antitoxin system
MNSITFIELSPFTRNLHRYMSEEEYEGVQRYLLTFPDAGTLIPGTRGCRKLRWGAEGRGKRGGVRIIYYWRRNHEEIWMLTIHAKNEEENLPPHFLRRLREEIDSE